MKPFHSVATHISIISSCFLLQKQPTSVGAASSSSPPSSPNNNHRETLQTTLEAARYSTLPPTVFAPGGRLYGVERVAKEAISSASSSDDEDAVSCGVFALHCGFQRDDDDDDDDDDDNDNDGEFAVMVGIGATSPFLHRDEAYLKQSSSSSSSSDGTINYVENHVGETYLPLTISDDETASSRVDAPLSILSPTIIVGTGGKAIDSRILLRRTTEVALSMYSHDNGGVDWFVSHSLEGIDGRNIHSSSSSSSSSPIVMGGAAGVDATSLVRRVADMAQSSTQSLGGRYGRMLSSSLLAVGARSPSNFNNNDDDNNATIPNASQSPDNDALALWRVDPTGQFWRLDASAVGRGASSVESELLRRVRSWKTKKNKQLQGDGIDNFDNGHDADGDESECDILREDVRAYLGGLSVEEAVEMATDCFVDGILAPRRKRGSSSIAKDGSHDGMMMRLERGLRERVQAVVIRSNSFGQMKSSIEIFK